VLFKRAKSMTMRWGR